MAFAGRVRGVFFGYRRDLLPCLTWRPWKSAYCVQFQHL